MTKEQQAKHLNAAIVHDWMPVIGGAERVVQELYRTFPAAKIYTLFDFLSDEERALILPGAPVETSKLQSLPGVKKYYRYLIASCCRAIEAFDVTHHDAVISSSAALAKGVITAPGQPHIAYVHSPARYAWDLTHQYISDIEGLGASIKQAVARRMMHTFRIWDMRTPAGVDTFVANSNFIKQRIWKVYRREAQVIYPPVDIDSFPLSTDERQGHYLVASRLVPYKQVPLVVEAFAKRPGLKLKVVGQGPDMQKVRNAAGPNVEILGHLPFKDLVREMQSAKAFVFAAKEDFGIMPVEVQACGTPVIALSSGGTAETVRPLGVSNPTGNWIKEQTVESILTAIDEFEEGADALTPQLCRDNAESFSAAIFRQRMADLVLSEL